MCLQNYRTFNGMIFFHSPSRCSSTSVYNQLVTACNGNTECRIVVGTSTFGDPCYRTAKYFSAAYRCVAPSIGEGKP